MRKIAAAVLFCWALVFCSNAEALSPQFFAVIQSQPVSGGGGGGGCTSIAGTVSSAVMQVDATCSNSYSGSGTTWSNIISAPADGSGQTAYDFYLGDGSSYEPVFTGSAGSTSAYFAMTNPDFFSLKSGTNTTFLNNLSKTTGGTDYWIVFALNVPSTGAQVILNGTDLENLRSTTSGKFSGYNGTGHYDSTQNVADSTDRLLIASYQTSTKTMRLWSNTSTSTSGTLSYTSTATPGYAYNISGYGGGTLALPTGSKVYGFAMGNAFLTNTDAANIITYYNALHGRVYAIDMREWLKSSNKFAMGMNDNDAIFERRKKQV